MPSSSKHLGLTASEFLGLMRSPALAGPAPEHIPGLVPIATGGELGVVYVTPETAAELEAA